MTWEFGRSGGPAALPKRLHVFGQSVAAGSGLANVANRMTGKVAQALGATEVNRAVGGSVVFADNTATVDPWPESGGWPTVLQEPLTPMASARPLLSPRQLVIHWIGNEVGAIAPEQFDTVLKPTLRACIDRHRAGLLREQSDGSFATTGTFSVNASTFANSGPNSAFTTDSGAKFTITVPATAHEGVVTTITPALAAGASVTDWYVDGVLDRQIDTTGLAALAAGQTFPIAVRFTGLAPGPHTIEARRVSGLLLADYWQADAVVPPLVVLPSSYRAGYGIYAGWPQAGQVTDSDVLALNDAIREVAAEYTDGRVLFVDVDSVVGKRPELLQGDLVHLNELGAARVAEPVIDAIVAHYAEHPGDVLATALS